MKRVVLTTAARMDIAEAADWYQAKRDGLGDEFLSNVDLALENIGSNPLAYRKVSGQNRRCPIDKFPYALFFKIEGDAIVVACLHHKRNPRIAIERGLGISELPKPKS